MIFVSEGTHCSVSRECCSFLLKRNIKKSEKHPQKYFFTRDSRLKANFIATLSQEFVVEMAKKLKMPYLFLQCKNTPLYELEKYHNEIVDIFPAHSIDLLIYLISIFYLLSY